MQRRAALMDVVEDPTAWGSTIAPSLCCDSPGSNDPLLLLYNYTKSDHIALGVEYIHYR